MDVTLGSLWGESLGVLEGLGWLDDAESSSNGSAEEEEEEASAATSRRGLLRQSAARSMSNRGLPLFEEMVDDSRLGRIKRRSGAHVGADGSTVEWSVVELDGGEGGGDAVMGEAVAAEGGNGNKRVKLGDWAMDRWSSELEWIDWIQKAMKLSRRGRKCEVSLAQGYTADRTAHTEVRARP
jgi:hypothetical protein